MYNRTINIGNLTVKSISINSPSDESLNNLANKIISLQNKVKEEVA